MIIGDSSLRIQTLFVYAYSCASNYSKCPSQLSTSAFLSELSERDILSIYTVSDQKIIICRKRLGMNPMLHLLVSPNLLLLKPETASQFGLVT